MLQNDYFATGLNRSMNTINLMPCQDQKNEIIRSLALASWPCQHHIIFYVCLNKNQMHSIFGWMHQKLKKIIKKDLNNKWQPWDMGTHLKVLCFLMNTSMTGFRWYSKIFASLFFWVKVALALERLKALPHHISDGSQDFGIMMLFTPAFENLRMQGINWNINFLKQLIF